MSEEASSILQKALDLADAERADIAAALLESLEPPADSGVEEAWRVEVARRIAASDAGEMDSVPWEEVRESLYARLRDAKS